MMDDGAESERTPRDERMLRRRADILRVAARLFAESGYERTTLEVIADELGLSKPTLYYYVKNKEDVLAQILEGVIQNFAADVETAITPDQSPEEQLYHVIRIHTRRICDYPAGRVLILYESHLVTERRPEIFALRKQYRERIEQIVEHGIARGIFHVADAKLATLAVLGALNWVARWYLPNGRLTPDEIGEHFARILIGGLINPATVTPSDA